MWANYLTVALRALIRDRMYAFINIFGLAVGLAACLILMLYVRYESSYDDWLPDADRVYQVQSISTNEDEQPRPQQAAHGVLAQVLPQSFPQIESIARMDEDRIVLLVDGEARFFPAAVADPTLFQVLQVPFLRGDPVRALHNVEALVLSRSQAMALFGSIDVVGRTVTQARRGERYERRVTGVFEDLPRNSNLDIQTAIPLTEEDRANCSWGCVNGYVWLKLKPGARADDINEGLPAWERRAIPRNNVGNGEMISEGDIFDWRLVNIRDVHLSGAEGSDTRPGNDRRTIVTFMVVALLILGMAAVNFVNLATARASKRAREVALRKVLGANRKQLVAQFLGESLLISGVAMMIALAFAELTAPYFAQYLRADLDVQYLGAKGIVLPVLGLWLAVGLVGGLYPAFYLSRYQPGEILKANKSTAEPRGSGRLRSVLVVGQFAVSIGLIICTIVVYAQTVFAQSTDLGFKRDGLIQVQNTNRAAVIPMMETMMREVARVPGVESVSAGNISVASGTTFNTNVRIPGRETELVGFYSVTPEFAPTMRLRLIAGRFLSRQFANDNGFTPYQPEEAVEPAQRALAARGLNIVLNELAARRMGYASPQEAISKQVGLNMFGDEIGNTPATIVGVVADSRFRSLREPVEPMIYYDGGIYRTMIIRYSSSNPEAVRQNIGAIWQRLTPDVPYEGEFADDALAEVYAADEARGQTFAGFAGLAVVIACLGLFGLAAFTAERRTKEIGIRKVFGARSRDIVQLLAWQFSKPVIVANLIAWPVAWWVMSDWLNDFDARIDLGPGPFVVAGLLALAIAIGTVSGHALRVSRTNPIHALRYE